MPRRFFADGLAAVEAVRGSAVGEGPRCNAFEICLAKGFPVLDAVVDSEKLMASMPVRSAMLLPVFLDAGVAKPEMFGPESPAVVFPVVDGAALVVELFGQHLVHQCLLAEFTDTVVGIECVLEKQFFRRYPGVRMESVFQSHQVHGNEGVLEQRLAEELAADDEGVCA
ncbi:MAG: hypothetical protein WBI82_08260 [Sphaerochaeta sp.]